MVSFNSVAEDVFSTVGSPAKSMNSNFSRRRRQSQHPDWIHLGHLSSLNIFGIILSLFRFAQIRSYLFRFVHIYSYCLYLCIHSCSHLLIFVHICSYLLHICYIAAIYLLYTCSCLMLKSVEISCLCGAAKKTPVFRPGFEAIWSSL